MLNYLKNKFAVSNARVDRPIFIVGLGRSGSTVLFDLVASHPDLIRTRGYPDGEDHDGWIKHGKCIMSGIGNNSHSRYGSGINGGSPCLHMTVDDATEAVVEGMNRYYSNEVLDGDHSKRVINKNPHLTNKLNYLLKIFPDAKILHIIRDCQPVVASWLAAFDDHPTLMAYLPSHERFPCMWIMSRPTDPGSVEMFKSRSDFYPSESADLFINLWIKGNRGVIDQMIGRESQLMTVRYEDLIQEPSKILSGIGQFCELSNFNFSVDHLDANIAERHKSRINGQLQRTIEVQAKTVREQFGYGEDRVAV